MRQIFILFFVSTALSVGCHKSLTQGQAPSAKQEKVACLDQKIKDFKARACETGNVKEYLFQSKLVYVFDVGRCGADFTTDVLDADCKKLGQLGGFTGNKHINGADFFATAKLQKTVWEKDK